MSQYDTVAIERQGAVAIVSMNRPDALNAFNFELRRELALAVEEINNDEAVRVAILTGAGRAFSAGADLAEKAAPNASVASTTCLSSSSKAASPRRSIVAESEQERARPESPRPVLITATKQLRNTAVTRNTEIYRRV